MNRMKFQRRQSRRLQRETKVNCDADANNVSIIEEFMKGSDLSDGKIEMEIARKIYLKMQEDQKIINKLINYE